jgi:hypothetical protein
VLIPDRGVCSAGVPPPHTGRRKSQSSAPTLHQTEIRLTRHQRGFKPFTRPVFPSPAAARMERAAASAFPRASHPIRPGAEQRTSGWGQATEHGPGSRSTTSAEPPRLRHHSIRATSRRTTHFDTLGLAAGTAERRSLGGLMATKRALGETAVGSLRGLLPGVDRPRVVEPRSQVVGPNGATSARGRAVG